MKLSLKSSLKLIKFKLEKVINLRFLKNVENFFNATSMENCFGIPAFCIGFCYYQLNQYGSYQPCEAALVKIKHEVLLNLDIAMKKKLVRKQQGGGGFCMSYMKCLSKCPYSSLCVCNTHLSFYPYFHPNVWVFANLFIYRKIIHDNRSLVF